MIPFDQMFKSPLTTFFYFCLPQIRPKYRKKYRKKENKRECFKIPLTLKSILRFPRGSLKESQNLCSVTL